MSTWKAIAVSCRADGRADSRPLRFMWEDGWLDVKTIVNSWLEQGPDPLSPVYRCFQAVCDKGQFVLRVDENAWLWQGSMS